ncbi:MAG TPA: ATP-binding protein [archaeon]|nr:ATP-binding protein [archaeon]
MKEIKEEEHSALHNDFVKKKQVNEREPDLFDEMLEPSAEKKSRKKEAEEKEFKEKETEQEEEREEEKEELIEKEIEEEAEENEKETLAKENEVNEVIEDDESFLYDVDEELDEEEDLDEDQVKKDIMEKALNESVKGKEKIPSGVPLTFLEDEKEKNVFIGRKKSIYQKYGYEGALLVGKVGEEEQNGKQVFLDSLNPHVVFVNGARGSGKSYVLGVIAEELAKKNKNVGMIVIDPIGVFWSMKFPNKEEKEIKSLGEWGLLPEGLDNLKVFVPGGIAKEVPKTTYDSTFSLKTSLLTGEDWCLTFGIDRFSPTGLLLEKALQNVSKGYKEIEGKKADKKEDKYSLDDIVHCLESSAELNSREKGFKQDSIRALISRFEAAKAWGIFSEHGTPLSELSKENQLSVIDSSFLDDDVTALVIGVLARRILSARKISTRKEAAQRIKTEDIDRLLEVDIPPTWLFIDEAHTLIPSGNITTPATKSLVEYVKQGRRPGCSLVFATQQPSAIDSRVLSQLDIILTHKLIFDDDIKAVFKRTPTIIPMKYKKPNFIKTLPIGVALTGDRGEETSRAFVMKVRPRMSQHEGRDAETSQMSHMLSSEQVESLMNELIYKKVLKEKSAGKNELINLINTINSKYNSRVDPENVFKELEKKGLVIGSSSASVKEELIQKEIASAKESFEAEKKEEAEEEQPIEPTEEGYTEQTELLAFPLKIDEKSVLGKIDKIRRKKILGFLGEEEKVESISLKHRTVWKVHYDYFNSKKEFISRIAFIDSVNGEFLHYRQGKFIESRGLSKLKGLNADEVKIIRFLKEPNTKAKDLEKTTHLDQGKIKKVLEKFFVTGLVDKKLLADKIEVYTLMAPIDLPPSPKSDLLESIKELPFVKVQSLAREREHFSKDEIPKLLHLLWPSVLVKKISDVFWPIYSVDLNFKGIKRTVLLDGLTAQIL